MQYQSVVFPLGEEVARDLDGVLVVVDLPNVEAVETFEKIMSYKIVLMFFPFTLFGVLEFDLSLTLKSNF